jgi:exopolysaccharide biosynthesis WecB/TagA/CpsF family protein
MAIREFIPSIKSFNELWRLRSTNIITINSELYLFYMTENDNNINLKEFETTLDSRFIYNYFTLRKNKSIFSPLPGSDILVATLDYAQSKNLAVLIIGGTKSDFDIHQENFNSKYSKCRCSILNLIVKEDGTVDGEEDTLISLLKTADFIFVALGAPKQEMFILRYQSYFNEDYRFAVGIGGALGFVLGIERRAPQLVQRLGIEWVWRVFRNPRRLLRLLKSLRCFWS